MKKSNQSPVHNPHDKLVRTMLSQLNMAKDLLDVFLPMAVKELVDLSILERQADTFVDAEHRMSEVDVLFKTKCKNSKEDCYIWILIEQQRSPDVWLPMRVFHYIGLIWEHVRKASNSRSRNSKLPFIYPLIISNASKPYKHSLHLRDLIQPDAAKPLFEELFQKPIQLLDLAAIDDVELRNKMQQYVEAHAFLLTMKHVFDDELQQFLETVLLSYYQSLDKMGRTDGVSNMLYYLYNEGNLNHDGKFWNFIQQRFSRDVEDKVMTLGQQAEQRALKQGIQQGIYKTANRMLEKKLDIHLISEVTHLSIETIKKLAKEHH